MNLRATLKVVIGAALIGAFVLISYEVFYWFTHVYENNARVQTELTNISAQVDGKIADILVKEGDRIAQGQLLIRLVDDDVRLNIEALRTDLALERAKRDTLVSEKTAFETELNSKLDTEREKIRAIEREYQAVQERLQLAERNLKRTKILFDKNLTPEAKLTVEQDKALVLRGEASILSGKIAVARKEMEQLRVTQRQIDVIVEKIKVSDFEQARILDLIRKQEVALGYRHIASPIDGVVGRIHKYKGEYVEDGINILMLHDPGLYWVEAYVDESQIRHVRVDQEVLINLDAYPFEDFYGKVRRIGSITTAQMGLADIANGSRFGSNIERVPVHVTLENPPPNLTPGMRAEINVRIYENIKLW